MLTAFSRKCFRGQTEVKNDLQYRKKILRFGKILLNADFESFFNIIIICRSYSYSCSWHVVWKQELQMREEASL
jgi:hypothetical protein